MATKQKPTETSLGDQEVVQHERKNALATIKPTEVLEQMILKRQSEFQASLPPHITFDKFKRVVLNAVIADPKLLQADRASLLFSCMKAAQDGLMPDKRDAALVIFNTKVKDAQGNEKWIDQVQYMPMYSGILKKVRQSEELASVVSHVVYEKDKFHYVLGDEEKIVHEPYMGAEPRGEIVAAYCVAKLKDGSVMREVMTRQDIEKIRLKSKSGAASKKDVEWKKAKVVGEPKGIWAEWYEEMAKKTVFRRLAKWLPQSADIMDALQHDDGLQVAITSHKGSEARDYQTIDGASAETLITDEVEEVTEDGEVIEATAEEENKDQLEGFKEKQAAKKAPAVKSTIVKKPLPPVEFPKDQDGYPADTGHGDPE